MLNQSTLKIISINFDDNPPVLLNVESSRKMTMFMRGYKEAEFQKNKKKLFIEGWNWNLDIVKNKTVWDEKVEDWPEF